MQQPTMQQATFDWTGMAADLNSLLRLKTTVIGMKMFARVEEMTAIPKIRRPTAIHPTAPIVRMASPAAIRVNPSCFFSPEPTVKIGNMLGDPCTLTNRRNPESPASSSMHARP